MTTLRTPTMRYGHPFAAIAWTAVLVLQHFGLLAAWGITPDLVLEVAAGVAAAAAYAFAFGDRSWAQAAGRSLAGAEAELRERVTELREAQAAPVRVEQDNTPVDGAEAAP